MPIYEYECPKCGRFEAVQKVSEKPLKAAPECSRKDCPRSAERVMSASAFHLKGSGWYKTDYASGSSGSAGSKKNPGSGTKEAKESAAGDSSSSSTDSTAKPKAGGCGSGCGCH